jgi:hypothetical protein
VINVIFNREKEVEGLLFSCNKKRPGGWSSSAVVLHYRKEVIPLINSISKNREDIKSSRGLKLSIPFLKMIPIMEGIHDTSLF